MGDINGFKKYKRQSFSSLPVEERVKNFDEFQLNLADGDIEKQAGRCMDCGVPFCHSGCPLGNVIPDFNDAVYREDWKLAYELLVSTNNFPEFTGRICPAPCEASCVLSINNDAVTIEQIEKTIIERAFEEGWVDAKIPNQSTDREIAIVGSGPAGLACADELSAMGHKVTVFEKDDRIGGLLRYGIPDFKLSKNIIDRRIDLMREAGVQFVTNTLVGHDISVKELQQRFDVTILCGGATIARDLDIEGRGLQGVHLAMDFLTQNNKQVAGDELDKDEEIKVKDENVVVLGGGDTGSDCIGTSHRLGAKTITQIELMNKPPETRSIDNPWPNWPQVLRTSSSQEEGCTREWSVLTKRFVSEDGVNLSGIETVKVEWVKDENGKYQLTELEGTTQVLSCQKAFLAIGFLHGKREGLLTDLGVNIDQRGNVITKKYATSVPNVFAAGDMRRGQSLVVWAIAEGRECAKVVNAYLSTSVAGKYEIEANAYSL